MIGDPTTEVPVSSKDRLKKIMGGGKGDGVAKSQVEVTPGVTAEVPDYHLKSTAETPGQAAMRRESEEWRERAGREAELERRWLKERKGDQKDVPGSSSNFEWIVGGERVLVQPARFAVAERSELGVGTREKAFAKGAIEDLALGEVVMAESGWGGNIREHTSEENQAKFALGASILQNTPRALLSDGTVETNITDSGGNTLVVRRWAEADAGGGNIRQRQSMEFIEPARLKNYREVTEVVAVGMAREQFAKDAENGRIARILGKVPGLKGAVVEPDAAAAADRQVDKFLAEAKARIEKDRIRMEKEAAERAAREEKLRSRAGEIIEKKRLENQKKRAELLAQTERIPKADALARIQEEDRLKAERAKPGAGHQEKMSDTERAARAGVLAPTVKAGGVAR